VVPVTLGKDAIDLAERAVKVGPGQRPPAPKIPTARLRLGRRRSKLYLNVGPELLDWLENSAFARSPRLTAEELAIVLLDTFRLKGNR
jgi:hypothetical protein